MRASSFWLASADIIENDAVSVVCDFVIFNDSVERTPNNPVTLNPSHAF